ncbi:hypothetical protein D3C76_1409220 [compost metagenome]
MGLAQHRGKIRTPLHRQAGEHQVTARRLQRQSLSVTSDKMRSATLGTRMVEHAFGDIQCQSVCLTETRAQRPGEITGAAAQVQPTLRHE